jgi:inhibitor of KinA
VPQADVISARVVPAGDSAWLIELPNRIDADVNARAIDLAADIEAASIPGLSDVVVGYRTVMVYADPLAPGAARVQGLLETLAAAAPVRARPAGDLVEIPVCYDGPFGPDLADVAAFARCDVEEVIARHLAREYRVFMVGFVPGFAYMATVDPSIAAPRRPTPRVKVPAGAVAIAAGQTGVYPSETPGGWHILGRTPVKPYDPDRAAPFLLRPGDRVRFRRIDEEDFRRTSAWGGA